jgi:hypothetical protein
VFAVIGLWPLMGSGDVRLWALGVAGILLVVSLAQPIWLAAGNRLWTRFGLLLHRITNPIIMGLVFFLAVTPTALILRMMGKDPLRRKIDRTANSYWIDREPPGPASTCGASPSSVRRRTHSAVLWARGSRSWWSEIVIWPKKNRIQRSSKTIKTSLNWIDAAGPA